MDAAKPSTFAVIFSNNYDLLDFESDNAIGEQLCGVRKDERKFQGLNYKIFNIFNN